MRCLKIVQKIYYVIKEPPSIYCLNRVLNMRKTL